MVLPAGHPFGCGGTALGAAAGDGPTAAAAGAVGFAGGGAGFAARICGGGVAGLATLAGGGEGEAVTGLAGVGSADGVAGFPAGTCVGVAGLFAGDCVPGAIAAEGVVGVEGFAAGVCGGGVAGLAVAAGADDGAAGVIAAEGVVVDGLAACVWHVRRPPVLTSPAQSRPRVSSALQPASARGTLRAWHCLRVRVSPALPRLTAMMVLRVLLRALAMAPVRAWRFQAPPMACRAQSRPKA